MSSTATYDFRTSGYTRTFENNCFYGGHPSNEPTDLHKVTTDPKLVLPGNGSIGLNTVNGYKLQLGSSCIDKGAVITNNGGKDFWGNTLYKDLPDIGAHEYSEATSAIDGPDNSSTVKHLSIYPNPVKDGHLFVKLLGSNYPELVTINIYNMVGQMVYNGRFRSRDAISLDLSSIHLSGFYNISVITDKITITDKFIVN
jgi:hypothetical protein